MRRSSIEDEPALVAAIEEGVRLRQEGKTSISLVDFHRILHDDGVPCEGGQRVFLTLEWGALRNFILARHGFSWPRSPGTRRS